MGVCIHMAFFLLMFLSLALAMGGAVAIWLGFDVLTLERSQGAITGGASMIGCAGVVAAVSLLLRELRAAVEPHARLRDLGSDDGVRTVRVEVDVKRLLQAVAGPRLVDAAYAAAVDRRYLWHEFGDSTLFLP